MNQLWPRLALVPALALYEERRRLDVEGLAALASHDNPRRTYAATGGQRAGDQQVLALVAELRGVAREFDYPGPPADIRSRILFDRSAAELVYTHMRMNTVEAANNEVWNFLALVAAPDLVRWRWPESKNAERWISSDRTRHMFARLWWQALTFAEPDAAGRLDFSLLRSLSERDLNQLTERRAVGGVPRLARAVARLALTDGAHDADGSALLRRITPALKRRLVFIDFASLSEDQINEHLRELRASVAPTPVPDPAPSDRGGDTGTRLRSLSPQPMATFVSEPTPPHDAPLPGTPRRAVTADPSSARLRVVDVCSGAGGLVLGLEEAGLEPLLLIDSRTEACESLRANRPHWDIRQMDLLDLDAAAHPELYGVDVLSAGLPRVQAAATHARLRGNEQELELLKATIDLLGGLEARCLLLDNVAELAVKDSYAPVRAFLGERLAQLGYEHEWFVVDAADFGVPQERRHGVLVAMRQGTMRTFSPPKPSGAVPQTVGQALHESMTARGWPMADEWASLANRPAPTLIGGSWERGGPDLGPTGSKRAWAAIGVDGGTVGDLVPGPDFVWDPAGGRESLVKLTVEQVMRLQSFPPDWRLDGGKTARYRLAAQATPPPIARALGKAVGSVLERW